MEWPEIRPTALLLAALVAMLVPSGAEAANVVNGDFESGALSGWQAQQSTGAGNWFAYTGTDAPIGSKRPTPADPVQPPPQGTYAAVSDEANPDALILYQDVPLAAGLDHQLSLLAYYDSYRPVAIPTPDTLSVDDESLLLPNGEFQKNQQFRIDVMRPEAPLESLDPADILRTVFTTKPGDPARMTPRKLTTNLSAFAGQTVRIRIANAVTEEVFNAGVDSVSVSTTRPAGQLPSGGSRRNPILFSFGRIKVNRHTGTAAVRVRVLGGGLLRAKGAPIAIGAGQTSTSGRLGKPIEPITVPVASAKTVTIHLRPTLRARAVLRQVRSLRVRVGVTFMPTDGSPEAASVPVIFRLGPRRPGRR
jgi:hypothetical protein